MIKINLLPYFEKAKKENVKRQISIIAGSSAIFLLSLMFFRIFLSSNVAALEDKVKDRESKLVELTKKLGDMETFKKDKAEFEQKLAVIRGLEENRLFPVRMMDELAFLVHSKDMWLVRIDETGPEIKIEGVARNNIAVAKFMKRLERSSFVSAVDLVHTKEKEVVGYKLQQFAISCALKKG